MRIHTLFEMEGEYLPFDRSKSSAHTIGSQLVRAALAKTGGQPSRASKIAHEMANRFASDVAATIDDELGSQKQASFNQRA